MTDFMGGILFFSGVVIVGISLYMSRHSKSSPNFDAIRHRMNDKQIGRILSTRPKRADATIGLYFGLFFIAVGLIRIAFVWWIWSHFPE